jgi:stage II sporulation protein AA (anti-sigma F factor antagonist)
MLAVERVDSVAVARPRGDIDASNADRLHDELAKCLDGGDAEDLVLDLGEVRYVDSAGIDMLFRLAERLRRRRARLLLAMPAGSPLLRLAEIVGLPRAVEIHPSVDEALAACMQHARA